MVMSWVRRLSAFLFGGAILGVVVATLVSPTYIAWDSTSAAGQALCNCVECVKNTTARLINAQLTGAAIGAFAMLVLGIVILRSLGRRSEEAAALTSGKARGPSAADEVASIAAGSVPPKTPSSPPPGSPPPM